MPATVLKGPWPAEEQLGDTLQDVGEVLHAVGSGVLTAFGAGGLAKPIGEFEKQVGFLPKDPKKDATAVTKKADAKKPAPPEHSDAGSPPAGLLARALAFWNASTQNKLIVGGGLVLAYLLIVRD